MMTDPMLDQEERAAGVASLTKRLRAIAGPETPLRSYVADLMRDAADALEAVERERDRLREEVADLEASFCAASFRVESERRAMLNRCTAVVSECDNSVPVFEIVERLSALAARTPEGGTDGE